MQTQTDSNLLTIGWGPSNGNMHAPQTPQNLPRDPEFLLKRGTERTTGKRLGKVLSNYVHGARGFDDLLVGPDVGGRRRRRRLQTFLERAHRLPIRGMVGSHIIS